MIVQAPEFHTVQMPILELRFGINWLCDVLSQRSAAPD